MVFPRVLPERQELREAFLREFCGGPRGRVQRLDLRREQELPARQRPVERPGAELIGDELQLPPGPIPDCAREGSVGGGEGFSPALSYRARDAIRQPCGLAQPRRAVQLAVERDDEVPRATQLRYPLAARRVDENLTQPGLAENLTNGGMPAEMAERRRHSGQRRREVVTRGVDDAADTWQWDPSGRRESGNVSDDDGPSIVAIGTGSRCQARTARPNRALPGP